MGPILSSPEVVQHRSRDEQLVHARAVVVAAKIGTCTAFSEGPCVEAFPLRTG